MSDEFKKKNTRFSKYDIQNVQKQVQRAKTIVRVHGEIASHESDDRNLQAEELKLLRTLEQTRKNLREIQGKRKEKIKTRLELASVLETEMKQSLKSLTLEDGSTSATSTQDASNSIFSSSSNYSVENPDTSGPSYTSTSTEGVKNNLAGVDTAPAASIKFFNHILTNLDEVKSELGKCNLNRNADDFGGVKKILPGHTESASSINVKINTFSNTTGSTTSNSTSTATSVDTITIEKIPTRYVNWQGNDPFHRFLKNQEILLDVEKKNITEQRAARKARELSGVDDCIDIILNNNF